jgi:hypothetical protein
MVAPWNDQNGSRPHPDTGSALYHYVIVRGDLPHGVQVAQTIHAAGESCEGPLSSGTFAIALSARSESLLEDLAIRLREAEVPHTVIREPDPPYDGQLMAIGIRPTRERDRIRRITSSLPLVR